MEHYLSMVLSERDAVRKLAADGPNVLQRPKRRSVLSIAFGTFKEPMFIFMLAAALLYLATGDIREGLFMVGAACVSIGLVVLQDSRGERALEALRNLAAPNGTIKRKSTKTPAPNSYNGSPMTRLKAHTEHHLVARIGWLRAAVLGANDGIVSTASLIVGVAAAANGKSEVLVAGLAGLVAGAMSMAAGEYVSVSSQADTEQADIARERVELAQIPEAEKAELTAIYMSRGLEPALAFEVAEALTANDALGAHMRDELGISHISTAKPVQAALTSAATFSIGAALPLAVAALMPLRSLSIAVTVASLMFLGLLGGVGAKAGGAKILRPTLRVLFWGALAMVATYGIGKLFGSVIG
jgi:vacuolar iron transporter family protein